MSEEPHDSPVLDYAAPAGPNATVPKPETLSLLARMRFWHSVSVWGLVATVGSSVLGIPFAGGIVFLFFLFAGAMTLTYMTRAAAFEVDRGYAARHLVLALLLFPVVFAGVFVVPLMVNSDVVKWRRAEEESGAA
jgi:hypothetical protein